MAFQNAQKTRASIGLLNASGYIRDLSHNATTDTLEVTTLADTAKAFIIGQSGSEGSFNMVLDTLPATSSQFAVIQTWKSTQPQVVDIAPEGYATGNPVIMVNALQTQATTQAAVGSTVDASVSFLAASDTDYGVSVEDYGAVTITGNGTARDGAAASANGGVAHLHVTSITNTSDTVTVEHSVDGASAWAVIATFTAATSAAGPTSQRVEVAAGTTIRRYLRVVDTVVGAGSTTRQISFARR